MEVKSGGYSPSATTRALAILVFSSHFFSFFSLSGDETCYVLSAPLKASDVCTPGECIAFRMLVRSRKA